MSEVLTDAPPGVSDRSASPPSEPDFFGRIPSRVLKRSDLTPTEKVAVAGIDRCCRGRSETDATDEQCAAECGLALSTFQRCLRTLRLKGVVEAVGRTCRRILRLVFGCKTSPSQIATPLAHEGSGLAQLPSPVKGIPLTGDENSPHGRGEFPSLVRDSGKGKEKSLKARSSSSSPGDGDTTTTAKTKTPPGSARPPQGHALAAIARVMAEAESQTVPGLAEWEVLDEAARDELRAEAKRLQPDIARWGNLIEPVAIALAAERSTETVVPATALAQSATTVVEVLPTDRQLGSLALLAHADDPFMALAARAELIRVGRPDAFAGEECVRPKGRAGQSRGLPARPKQPN